MFDTRVAQMKAGHIGQVVCNSKVLWESEPFPVELTERPEDKLRRREDVGYEKALLAACGKIDEVMERLFA